jgi:hypothetical protein
MENLSENLLKQAYAAFNARDIEAALATMHPAIEWPKAFEGGYVRGHAEIRSYWTRQLAEINPRVEPIKFTERPDGTIEVAVQQLVKNLAGEVLVDGVVKHVYRVQDGLLRKMDIELD